MSWNHLFSDLLSETLCCSLLVGLSFRSSILTSFLNPHSSTSMFRIFTFRIKLRLPKIDGTWLRQWMNEWNLTTLITDDEPFRLWFHWKVRELSFIFCPTFIKKFLFTGVAKDVIDRCWWRSSVSLCYFIAGNAEYFMWILLLAHTTKNTLLNVMLSKKGESLAWIFLDNS